MPRDAIDSGPAAIGNNNTNYATGIVDEAMQWNKDREGSDLGSNSDSGKAVSVTDSSAQSSRGLDVTTLYFKKDDVIMLVDGRSLSIFRGMRIQLISYRLLRHEAIHEVDICALL